MKIGDWFCKNGMHNFKPATKYVKNNGWYSLFDGKFITHYECSRCKEKRNLSTLDWDGTDNA